MRATLLVCLLGHFAAPAHAKFEDWDASALVGATVMRVTCGAEAGRVVVARDPNNFAERGGTVDVAVTADGCARLERRTFAALRCWGHARIDLFLDRSPSGVPIIVDVGFARNEGVCDAPTR